MRFNPRARVGRDAIKAHDARLPEKFQSTRPRGARPRAFAHSLSSSVFQSTRPRGARRFVDLRLGPAEARFNPRARVGRDYSLALQAHIEAMVSIHAPAWGATVQRRRYP